MALGSLRGRSSVAAMPIIAEDDTAPPVVPNRSAARPFAASNLRTSYQDYSPFVSRWSPATSDGSDSILQDRKQEPGPGEGFKDHEWIARRGGWYRLVMLVLITIGLVVGLSVGLTLRLKKKYVPKLIHHYLPSRTKEINLDTPPLPMCQIPTPNSSQQETTPSPPPSAKSLPPALLPLPLSAATPIQPTTPSPHPPPRQPSSGQSLVQLPTPTPSPPSPTPSPRTSPPSP